MERTKYILAFFFLAAFINVQASYKMAIYNAYIKGDMVSWKKIIDEMHSLKSRNDNAFLLELLNYEYGFVAWCIGNDKQNLAEEYIARGEKNIRILEENDFELSHVYAYKAAFYGYKIAISVMKAAYLGPASVRYAREAMDKDPENPHGYIQYGNSRYFMPESFGGSKLIALQYYRKALLLMEQSSSELKNDWNYLNLLIAVANCYAETGQKEEAGKYYEKILKIAPDFSWAKELYNDNKKIAE